MSNRTVDVEALVSLLGWSAGPRRLTSTEDLRMFSEVTGLSSRAALKLLKKHRGDRVAALRAYVGAPRPGEREDVESDGGASSETSSCDTKEDASSEEGASPKKVRFSEPAPLPADDDATLSPRRRDRASRRDERRRGSKSRHAALLNLRPGSPLRIKLP